MKMTGEAQRTISSTAVGATASKSAAHDGALVGVLGEGPQAVADGVARGLVAGHHQQDEERGQLGVGERLAVDVGVDQRRGEVVGGVLDAVGGQAPHELGQVVAGVHEGQHGVLALGDVLGVAEGQDDVGAVEDGVVVALGHAHHVADDLEREPGRHLGDEVALALVPHLGDEVVGDLLDVVLDGAHHAGVEGGRDDPAQPGVAGVVHVDHGPEELEELGRHVEDGGARLARAEELGVPADLDHVGVAGEA